MSKRNDLATTTLQSFMNSIKNYLKLIRPKHYVKNLFIFAPLFFAAQLTQLEIVIPTILAFFAFSITASAVYVFNDFFDIKNDRQHPEKKHRPLASGVISKKQAIFLMLLLLSIGLATVSMVSSEATVIFIGYLLMNVAYSIRLKQIALIDVCIVAIGFVLRLFIGASVAQIHLSPWIVIITFLLALFMALAKRRDDVLIYMETGKKMRKVIDGYNLQLLDTSMGIMASVVIVAYVIYTTSAELVARLGNEYVYLTSLFVILAMMRYLKITFVHQKSSSPVKILLNDRFIQLSILGWVSMFTWLIY